MLLVDTSGTDVMAAAAAHVPALAALAAVTTRRLPRWETFLFRGVPCVPHAATTSLQVSDEQREAEKKQRVDV